MLATKNVKIFTFLVLVSLWACNNGGDDKKPVMKEINWGVNAIVVDKNNTKWVGTETGLFKSITGGYDSVPLATNGKIGFLFYEEQGDLLWIGTETGLFKADIAVDEIAELGVDQADLSSQKINALHIDSGAKRWFGTGKGISMNYGETWKKENFRINSLGTLFAMDCEGFAINSIASWDGDYFFATGGSKIYRAFDYDETVDAFTGASQWDPPYNGESISDTMFVVFVDKQGNQWMGGTKGIQVHSGHDPKDAGALAYHYDELPDTCVMTINEAPDGDIWVGTRKGLAIYDGSNWAIVTGGLPSLYITAIAFDKDGTAWVGTKQGLVNIE